MFVGFVVIAPEDVEVMLGQLGLALFDDECPLAVAVGGSAVRGLGDVVAARRPHRRQAELINRIRESRAPGTYSLLGDNPLEGTVSRHFGVVTQEHMTARVRWRYWPLPPRALS